MGNDIGTCQAMSMSLRTEPPSSTPNNQDVFVWALYLLGGADQDIDVEAIYLKCFELAPARLAWRTRPDLPDYKKISKALQSIEANTHTGLLLRPHEYSRRLTVDGVRWVETYKEILQATYSGVVQASASNNQYEHRRKLIKSDPVWLMFKNEPSKISSIDLASALNCQPASSENTWRSRINDVLRAADVLKDDELKGFAFLAEKIVLSGQQ
jgi:hypothetical protein